MANYYSILTTTGQNKIAAAQSSGPALNLTEFAVGDSGGAYFDPLETQVSLVNELWRGAINRIYVHPDNANQIVIEAVIPVADGGFDIREAGVFDATGDLIAVGKYPLTTKPAPGSGSEKDLYVRMILKVTNAISVAQTIDPSLVLATKKYVDDNLSVYVNDPSGAPVLSKTVLSITGALTEGVWKSIGPTGSGADYIWTALDGLPSHAKWIKLRFVCQLRRTSGPDGTAQMVLYAKSAGSAESLSTQTKIVAMRVYGGTTVVAEAEDVITHEVPVADRKFELCWSESESHSAVLATLLTGYG